MSQAFQQIWQKYAPTFGNILKIYSQLRKPVYKSVKICRIIQSEMTRFFQVITTI